MKATMQLRMSQHLALTPQLQQSIRLLQLSTLELHQEVQQMLDDNPFLELDEEQSTPWESSFDAAQAGANKSSADADEPSANVEPGEANDGSAVAELSPTEFDGRSEREDWANGTEGDDFDGVRELPSLSAGATPEGDEEGFELAAGQAAASLAEHLRGQVAGLRLNAEDAAAVQVLIDSLNDDGYLEDSLPQIAERLAAQLGISTDPEDEAFDDLNCRLRCARLHLQRLEPAGVGAANLAECLTLQLKRRLNGHADPALQLALALAAHHLEAMAKREHKRLLQLAQGDEQLLKAAQALIRQCEPKPGRAFGPDLSPPVLPDVIVQRRGRRWQVVLNPDVAPKLRIHSLYAQALKSRRGAAGTAFGARLQEARWFMRNIEQRFDTILRVASAIVEHQQGFFNHGAIAMKPLVLREIADELGLHESTISRVTTAKYMASPQGTFELKHFFGSSLNTEAGGNASSTAVRALIQQLVAAEDGRAPLSDSALAQMLEAQGIQVARRTVAKYREALKIAPANFRRVL
jgi:RNA polymerase sigma-54 factor